MAEEKIEKLPFANEADGKKEDDKKPESEKGDKKEVEKKFDKPPKLRIVCSLSCSLPARDFIGLAKKHNIQAILDTRVNRQYRGNGFQTAEDDFRFLCELAEIDYHVVETLAPTKEMREQFGKAFKYVDKASDRDPMAWTRFLEAYGNLLRERKPSRHPPLFEIIHGDYEVIAVVCACRHHDDCHRSMACGLMANLFPEVELRILYPQDDPPPRASPRRYRLKDFPWAGLKAEKPGGKK